MKRLIRYARHYYIHIAVAALASIGCSLANVWVIDILKQIIDFTLSGDIDSRLPEILGKAALAIGVGLLTNYLVVSMTGLFGAGILKDMRRDAIKAIMKCSPDFMEKNNFGDIMERMSSDMETIAGYMKTYFKDCIYVPIVVIVFAAYLFSLNPLLALVSLLPLAVLVPISINLLKPVKLAQADYVKKLGLTNNHIQEAFDGVEVIKSYNLQASREEKYYDALKETFDISNKNDLRQYNIEPISALIREAPTAITLCVGGVLAFGGTVSEYISIGMLIAFISGIQKINQPLVNAYQLVIRSQMALVAANRVFFLLDMPAEENGEGLKAVDTSGDVVFRLDDVSFSYGEKYALDKINLTIHKGKKIALVGKSGSGKSTILKLLCRQYEAKSGELYFFNHKFSEVSPEAMRKCIAIISQDTILFPMSVADNIRVGNPDATREEMMEAARLAGCDEFIQNMPDGYDTVLEEKGSNLSGGQRQRLSIARAILKDAPILLLDEPTSALDRETEEFINNTLSEIAKGKTVVTVAHRLSTITNYDEIIVMDEGKIIGQGTHRELWCKQEYYYKMYNEYVTAGGAK